MTQTYRTDDLTKWGTGKGSNLTAAEVDINFWDAIQRIVTLEAVGAPPAAIDHFTVSGSQFYVVLSDATSLGPYTLPVSAFRARGAWAPSTAYLAMDTVTVNGGLYLVIFAHTSASSFSAGANDGAGHDYYSLMIQTPGSSLPTGGGTGQVLTKSSGTDYAVSWTYKYPAGGTARQYLIKVNSTQDNAAWGAPQAHDISFTPVTGSSLTSTNVADAIEEAANVAPNASVVAFTPPTGSTLVSTNVADALEELSTASEAAVNVTFTPATGSQLSSLNVQDAIEETLTIGNHCDTNFSVAPIGNVSTTEKAMGLGFTITPLITGVHLVWIGGMAINSTAAGDGVTITGRYGTGTPPVNGATSGLGTQLGTPQHFVASTAAGQQGFIIMAKLTGLTVGTTYWIDLSIVAVTGGGASVKDVQFVAIEAS